MIASDRSVAGEFRAHLQTEWRQRQTVYEAHEWTVSPDGEDECALCYVTWEEATEECKR